MLTYILRRILLMFPTLIGITLVVFIVMASAPGGLSVQSLIDTQGMKPEERRALEAYYNKLYGLDQPAPLQYLKWLNNVSPIGFTYDDAGNIKSFSIWKETNLGRSFTYNRPVATLLAERVPITLLLNIITIPIIYLVSISVGVRAASQRGESFDINSSFISLGLWSVPTMLAGVLLLGYFANDQYWHWFPTAGLNQREGFDMPFLPHWSDTYDIIKLFGFGILGCVSLVAVSQFVQARARTISVTIVGIVLGWLAAHSLPGDISHVTTLALCLGVGALGYVVGAMTFSSFRTVCMGLLGLLVGCVLALHLMQGTIIRGFLFDRLWHLVLPVICLTYGSFAFMSKLSRTAVLENLLSDYARTARAKGVTEKDVLWRHVFRNSLLPLITVSASLLPALLGGSVIVESIFSIDGMGKLAIESVTARDRELVLSITLISGVLTLVGYLIADIFYALADPRISYD